MGFWLDANIEDFNFKNEKIKSTVLNFFSTESPAYKFFKPEKYDYNNNEKNDSKIPSLNEKNVLRSKFQPFFSLSQMPKIMATFGFFVPIFPESTRK